MAKEESMCSVKMNVLPTLLLIYIELSLKNIVLWF